VLEEIETAQLDENVDFDLILTTRAKVPNANTTLIDILIRNDIIVIEPFWTSITNNKAILGVLTLLYPNHPNLLKTTFTLEN